MYQVNYIIFKKYSYQRFFETSQLARDFFFTMVRRKGITDIEMIKIGNLNNDKFN
jgi:hypothetical protein